MMPPDVSPWWCALKKREHRGSRPRCILLVDGRPEVVSARLTALVGLPEVTVSPTDHWMPNPKFQRQSQRKSLSGQKMS